MNGHFKLESKLELNHYYHRALKGIFVLRNDSSTILNNFYNFANILIFGFVISSNKIIFIMKQKFFLFILFALASFKMHAQCSASFTSSASPNGVMTFTSTGTNSMFANYYWSFGNGASGYGQTTTAVYNAPGTYTVCLYVTDTVGGCSDSSCTNVTVTSASSCYADFTYICNVNNTASLTSTGSSTPQTVYTWSGPNGVFATGSTATFVSNPGTYTICLHIEDTLTGCVDSMCQTLTLGTTQPCAASFYIYPDSSQAHTYWGVNGSSMNSTTTYYWTWGDGNNSTGAYPSHTYAAAGNYTICLYINDPATGCSDSMCIQAAIAKTAGMYSVTFLEKPSSVASVQKSTIGLYPNPVQNTFMIQGNSSEEFQVAVYNLNGSKVKQVNAHGNEAISVIGLPMGHYTIKAIDQAGKVHIGRFIKE